MSFNLLKSKSLPSIALALLLALPLSQVLVSSNLGNKAITFSSVSETIRQEAMLQPSSNTGSFSFAAVGDFGYASNTFSNWRSLNKSNNAFVLGLGDFVYSTNGIPTELAWCNAFKSNFKDVELIVGARETWEKNQTFGGGSMNKFIQYCPFTLGMAQGTYGYQYYFDYPTVNPLARFIMVMPDIWANRTSVSAVSYGNGTTSQAWVGQQIDNARAAGIPWVIVGMQKLCLSAGLNPCEIGPGFMRFLIQKRVDLVLEAHDHLYARTNQLVCATPDVYVPSCVLNSGLSGTYWKGVGTIFVVDGTGGESLGKINPAGGDYPYFATTNNNTYGYTQYTMNSSTLSARFVNTVGPFTETWSITETDMSPPTWPIGRSLTNGTLIGARTTLTWTSASDNVGIAYYKLYENNSFLALVPGNVNSYTVTGLKPLTTYVFQVEAGDWALNWSTNGLSDTVRMPSSPQGPSNVPQLPVPSSWPKYLYALPVAIGVVALAAALVARVRGTKLKPL